MGSPAAGRTVLEFEYNEALWDVVTSWADEHGYKQVSGDDNDRILQKGTGFLVAPMMCHIQQQGSQIKLEAWIRVNLFMRIMGLFLIPAEMGIASGGFKLVAPRNIARKAVNKLLEQLDQEPIA